MQVTLLNSFDSRDTFIFGYNNIYYFQQSWTNTTCAEEPFVPFIIHESRTYFKIILYIYPRFFYFWLYFRILCTYVPDVSSIIQNPIVFLCNNNSATTNPRERRVRGVVVFVLPPLLKCLWARYSLCSWERFVLTFCWPHSNNVLHHATCIHSTNPALSDLITSNHSSSLFALIDKHFMACT